METERMSNKKGKRFKREKGKLGKKKIIIILLIFIFVIGIGSAGYFFKKDHMDSKAEEKVDKKVEITSGKLLEEKIYKDMKIKDISLKIDESASYFKCKLENVTDKKFEKEDTFIVFIKEDNSELARFKYQITSIEPSAEGEISIVTTNRLTAAYDFYIKEIK